MKIFSYILVFILSIYIFYGLYISRLVLNPDKSNVILNKKQLFYDYKGVINVHSRNGVGEGTVPEILKAAYESKLDFVVFTESSVFNAALNKNKYEGNLLVINGREYSYLKSRLILIDPEFDYSQIKNAADAHLYLSDFLEQKSEKIILLKHPLKEGYEWEGDFAKGIDGIEIISLRDNWRQAWDNSKLSFIGSLLIYPFNPNLAFLNIYQTPKKNLKLWYKISKERKIIGLIGSDAKSKLKIFRNKYIRFPSYKKLFELSSNHVLLKSELTGNFKKDFTKLTKAIEKGQFYFSLDFLGDPSGFSFYTKSNKNEISPMGTTLSKNTDLICIKLPRTKNKLVEAKILVNGELLKKLTSDDCILPNQSGAYSVIVNLQVKKIWPLKTVSIPWIYSNFIYVQ